MRRRPLTKMARLFRNAKILFLRSAKILFLLILFLSCCLAAPAFAQGGRPVGAIRIAQGAVTVYRWNQTEGIPARDGLTLFARDTIVTGADGRTSFEFNDKSRMTLAGNTRLTISRSVFDPDAGTRTSFVTMALGRARFAVREVMGYKNSDFKVKTQTAIIGVRGSDFLVRSLAERTEVTALKETELTVVGIGALDEPPRIIEDFQRTVIEEGAAPSPAISVSPEEIERELLEIGIDMAFEPDTEDIESAAADGATAVDDGAEPEAAELDEAGAADQEVEYIPSEALAVDLGEAADVEAEGGFDEAFDVSGAEAYGGIDEAFDDQEEIIDDAQEDVVEDRIEDIKLLPALPGPPGR